MSFDPLGRSLLNNLHAFVLFLFINTTKPPYMSIPGTYYEPSGFFSASKAIIYTAVGCVVAIFVGWLYAVISHVNPLIYLNFLLLIGAILVMVFTVTLIK